ncbi:UDP-N-acetylmuramoyl-L-alanyl-D-glutamate--2,6-diaminopimelate ligase [Pseudolycoriella hygida]|uniref:UDP-N-acetylmuramoyl-L-alanyl-D-glutamate--2, 6-diaminopimelate ligase n=1 Tax=Pseudolycoriella hygida TaxID=35572 RepID=A0A9Q0N6W5_9DIPT|nr:UDP-N-acetylmuramoyl-L-alanyl-D-glutamate--2,6-diaminopimelate ligase [Pseudolycoriella hygida]
MDSRIAKAGDIFFAIKGGSFDGNQFVEEVIKKGVKFIVTDNPDTLNNSKATINEVNISLVEDTRIALAEYIDIFYPLFPKYMVAATGTNGKTSVVSYCLQLYSLLGVDSSSIGTIGVEHSKGINLVEIKKILENFPNLTTLDPITIRCILHILADNNVNYVAFEASSHGLDQKRIEGIKVQAACFTSFSQDHLDYHKTMDAYLLAKLRLFTDNLLPGGIAILNSEIPKLNYIKSYLQMHHIEFLTIGRKGDLDITATEQSIYGQNISFTYKGQPYNFDTTIIGSFQAVNLLISVMMVHFTGFHFEEIILQLPNVVPVKGRLARASDDTSPYHVFIDYAHTPDALEKTLLELKKIKLAGGLLKVVFGCGGNRDSKKRKRMGYIASKIADQIIITDDNPRHEQPNLIRQQIICGILSGFREYIGRNCPNYIEIGDRKAAIVQTISSLHTNDILLIAGKGHENYQIIQDIKLPFNDFEVAKEALDSRN